MVKIPSVIRDLILLLLVAGAFLLVIREKYRQAPPILDMGARYDYYGVE